MARSFSLLILGLLIASAGSPQERPQSPSARPMPEAAEAQAAAAVEGKTDRRSDPARPADPFAEDLARALRAEANWLGLHEALMEEFDSLPPCGTQAVERIVEARDAAFEAFAKRSNYLRKHSDHAADLYRRAQESQSGLTVDRSELEASSRQVAQELDAARKRRAALAESLSQRAETPDESEPQQVLDELIAKLEREARLMQDALQEYDRSREHLRGLLRWARERQSVARKQLDLVGAESRLWKAFYDGLTFRLELNCAKSRPKIHEFKTISPREIRP